MPRAISTSDKAMRFAKRIGAVRLSELREHGVHPESVRRLCEKGLLIRTARGLYRAADTENITENHGLVEAGKMVPHGVICLYSALRFHNIGTQNPSEIWIALDRRAARPRISYPPLRIVRFSAESMKDGIETHLLEGVRVRITCPARTVADCFKYRNKYGLDAALEALKESIREKRFSMDQLWHFAKLARVANIMMPYLQAI